jgi:hypothetical protein
MINDNIKVNTNMDKSSLLKIALYYTDKLKQSLVIWGDNMKKNQVK